MYQTMTPGKRLRRKAVFTAWIMKSCKELKVLDPGNITCQNVRSKRNRTTRVIELNTSVLR